MVICIDTLHRRPGAASLVHPDDHAAAVRRGSEPSASHERSHDRFRFLREWWRDPLATAALAPSGKALTSLITGGIHAGTGAVLELGPGTGVFTQGLLMRGVAQHNLTLVERNPTFARLLKQRFPSATILGIDAAELADARISGSRPFGAAVCGLGLRAMHVRHVEAIMRAVFTRMRPDASLYLFTYGRRCSVPDEVLLRLGLVAERVGMTLRNVPPASVYRLATLAGSR